MFPDAGWGSTGNNFRAGSATGGWDGEFKKISQILIRKFFSGTGNNPTKEGAF